MSQSRVHSLARSYVLRRLFNRIGRCGGKGWAAK